MELRGARASPLLSSRKISNDTGPKPVSKYRYNHISILLLLLLLLLLYTAIGFSPGGSSPYISTHNTNGKLQNSTYSKYKYTH
jgi:hypothetical protein